MNRDEAIIEVMNMMGAKADFIRALSEVVQYGDKNKLIEVLVENAAHDIQLVGSIMHLLGASPTEPLSDIDTEDLKAKMFKLVELSQPSPD